MAQKASSGDKVQVHYTGKLDSGEVFDSSSGRDPLSFELGSGQVIPGFERAVEGMEVGETREVRIEPDDAYGQRRDDLRMQVPRTQFPDDVDPSVGDAMRLQDPNGGQHMARVVDTSENEVTLDLNHPLAGQALNFELTLVDVD